MIPTEFNPIFKSYFAEKLQMFLTRKRAIGYRYRSEARILVRIDKYLSEGNIAEITDDTMLKWITKCDSESDKTHSTRIAVLRQFCMFLSKRGIVVTLPLCPTRGSFSKSFTPYIFTKEQITCILHNAENTEIRPSIPSAMPVILRLLYCCGLRIGEATALRVRDIDLKRDLITVMNGKNDDCRIIPIAPSLKTVIANHLDKIYTVLSDDDFVFPTKYNEQYSTSTIYKAFREVLWRSGIPHRGKSKGPRLHDIRHTFAVHSLQKSIYEGRDTYLLLPILSTYMGHKSIYATEKYLRLTPEMFPDIIEKVQNTCGRLIPEAVDYETD